MERDERRIGAVALYRARERGRSPSCRAYGISRKTGKRSYEAPAKTACSTGAGRLITSPTPAKRIVEANRGVHRLAPRHRPRRRGRPSAPRGDPGPRGLVQRRRQRRRAKPWNEPFAHAIVPNDVWCIDFKGWFRTGDGTRVDPLTVQDAASRYLIACRGRATGPETRRALARAFREFSARQRPGEAASPRWPSGGSSWVSSLSGPGPSNRTDASAPSPVKAETASPPREDGSGATFRHSSSGPWDSDPQALHPLVPALSLTPQLAGIRGRGCAECATTARSSGRGRLSESLRGEEPRPARRAHLVEQFGPLLIGGRAKTPHLCPRSNRRPVARGLGEVLPPRPLGQERARGLTSSPNRRGLR